MRYVLTTRLLHRLGVWGNNGQLSVITRHRPVLPAAFAKHWARIFFTAIALDVFAYGPE